MTVKEYGVIKSLVLVNLINEIDKLMVEGWQPAGGVSAASGKFTTSGDVSESGTPGILYVQAIVR